jgi:hypothetical protein
MINRQGLTTKYTKDTKKEILRFPVYCLSSRRRRDLSVLYHRIPRRFFLTSSGMTCKAVKCFDDSDDC